MHSTVLEQDKSRSIDPVSPYVTLKITFMIIEFLAVDEIITVNQDISFSLLESLVRNLRKTKTM